MKFFNAFQLVSLFSAGPFLITYAHEGTFYAHDALSWVLIVGYLIGFGAMVGTVANDL